jgi:NADH-quinone oxidoreductase subunit L
VITAFHHKFYDIYTFGNLRKYMPVTYAAFVVGALALAGVFPLSGFWSKDRLIGSYYEAGFVWGVLGTGVAFVTAYYIFREAFVVFHGEERFRRFVSYSPEEVPSVMTVPMVILGVMAVIAGFFEGWYMSAVGGEHKEIHLNVALMSVGVALAGVGLAYAVFVRRLVSPESLYPSLRPLHTLFKEQFFTEWLYHRFVAKGYLQVSRVAFLAGDRTVIDGTINHAYRFFLRAVKVVWKIFDVKSIDLLLHCLAIGSFRGGRLLRNLQTGLVNNYVMFLLIGILVILGIMLFALERVEG